MLFHMHSMLDRMLSPPASGYQKNRSLYMAVSLVVLLATLCLDIRMDVFLGPQWTFLLFYMILAVIVNDRIAGVFGYVFGVLAALSRSYTGTLVWNGFATEAWSAFNCVIGFTILCYLIQSKNRVAEELRRCSLTDPLTRLPNRRAFGDRLKSALAHARRHNEPVSIAYVDVDRFKMVNDTYGHHKGDLLLCCIADHISQHLRADDLAARIGGDEFAIIYSSTRPGSAGLIQRIKHDLDEMCRSRSFDVSFSVGVVNYDGVEDVDSDQILSVADSLMYEVKRGSKNAIKTMDYSCCIKRSEA